MSSYAFPHIQLSKSDTKPPNNEALKRRPLGIGTPIGPEGAHDIVAVVVTLVLAELAITLAGRKKELPSADSGDRQCPSPPIKRIETCDAPDGDADIFTRTEPPIVVCITPLGSEEQSEIFTRLPPLVWRQALIRRDGAHTNPSVKIVRQGVDPVTGREGRIELLEQHLNPRVRIEDCGHLMDTALMQPSERRKILHVVVKRGDGVDYEEKPGSRLIRSDIRRDFPGMTWGQIQDQLTDGFSGGFWAGEEVDPDTGLSLARMIELMSGLRMGANQR
ncbi:hypothetical protein GE09DRAFT_1282037 [Coniochaeta sp. 2T2.1]|nr:hypothetical protein GE09DRAFT_1282037 [Coniochaeta sp. 2T2.1]